MPYRYRYECPACGILSASIRCPQCGGDTDELSDGELNRGTIFDHAQHGHKVAPAKPAKPAKPDGKPGDKGEA